MLNVYYMYVFSVILIVGHNCGNVEPDECPYTGQKDVPKLIYNQLKCSPIVRSDKCIETYECPHIDRAKNTCYFKGDTIKIGDKIRDEHLSDVWAAGCSCNESLEFDCPELTDGCAESWISGYPKPFCYLRKELNSYCAGGEICPPFEGNAECTIDNKVYREGEGFPHPTDKCMECVCDKGFVEGKFEAPICQTLNCTDSMLQNSKKIDQFCAPFYKKDGLGCCPDSWICQTENDNYTSNPDNSPAAEKRCTFGNNKLAMGDYITQKHEEFGKVKCECLLPPYLYCTA